MKIENLIKLILSLLFFICLFKMPYGYYELIRFISLISFSFLAYRSYKNNNEIEVMVYIALALLFQPFFKIALGRTLWNILDILIGLVLLSSVYFSLKKRNR